MAQLEVLKWSNAFLNNLGAYIDAWGECCEFSKVCITTYYTVIIHPAAPEDRWVILTRLARRPTHSYCMFKHDDQNAVHGCAQSLLCVYLCRPELDNGSEDKSGGGGRAAGSLLPTVDSEMDPPESRKKQPHTRWPTDSQQTQSSFWLPCSWCVHCLPNPGPPKALWNISTIYNHSPIHSHIHTLQQLKLL